MTTLLTVWGGGIAAAVVMAQVLVAQTVQTESGEISGVPGGLLVVYKGVPFAAPQAPPSASHSLDLRWRISKRICGLMDQIAALEWVQRNIAAFGYGYGTSSIICVRRSGAGARRM